MTNRGHAQAADGGWTAGWQGALKEICPEVMGGGEREASCGVGCLAPGGGPGEGVLASGAPVRCSSWWVWRTYSCFHWRWI